MEESEGRRIKRAISIDMDSIRFCNHDFLAKLSNSTVIGDYIRKKQQEVKRYNSEKGLPIEIYVFCRDQRWAHYEAIQADIFDHLIAVLPEFHLRVYQNPSAACFDQLKV